MKPLRRCFDPETSLRKSDYYVAHIELTAAQDMVARQHYAKGGSNTAVFTHGLIRRADNRLCGICWWLPPTRVAAESVNYDEWERVLSLTRLVVEPDIPYNGASFMLARSRKLIEQDGRFISLVTYADESEGHTGSIYYADNWGYEGRTGPYPKWIDSTGRQVAAKATKNRTKAEMLALGHTFVGRFYKHKFTRHLF